MANACKLHAQFFNFMDRYNVHVIEATRTILAQVEAGTYEVRDSMSEAERHLVTSSQDIRIDYAQHKISAVFLLAHAACHFDSDLVAKAFKDVKDHPSRRFVEVDAPTVGDPEVTEDRTESVANNESDGKEIPMKLGKYLVVLRHLFNDVFLRSMESN
jgi:hypothetical protein